MKTANIMLTNDDGIHSPGIAAALEALHPTAEVTVCAPLHQQTAMGRAQTGAPDATLVQENLLVKDTRILAYSCDASPATTVRHGLRVLNGYKADLLVSGINYGENLSTNITSSGTVGAALEGACRGIPSLAISLETDIGSHYKYTEQNWQTAMHFLSYFAGLVLERGLPADAHILKIDVPSNATADTPWQLTRLSPYMYYQSRLENPSLDSTLADAITTRNTGPKAPPGSDVYALCVDKVVSVTPLTLDFTSRTDFSTINSWLTEPGTRK